MAKRRKAVQAKTANSGAGNGSITNLTKELWQAAVTLRAFWHHPPHPQKLPIAPIFIADSISLAVSREKNGNLRIVYAGWDNANVVQPDGYGQARGGWEAVLTPLTASAGPPPKN